MEWGLVQEAFNNLVEMTGKSEHLDRDDFLMLTDLPPFYVEKLFNICNYRSKKIENSGKIFFEDVERLVCECSSGTLETKINLFFDTFRAVGKPYITRRDLVGMLRCVPSKERETILKSLASNKASSTMTNTRPRTPSALKRFDIISSLSSGWMWKLGRHSHLLKGRRWKRRWFTLKGRSLEWSKGPSKKIKGRILLTSHHSIFKMDSPFVDTFGFRLWCSKVTKENPREEIQFVVKLAGDVRCWIENLKRAIEQSGSDITSYTMDEDIEDAESEFEATGNTASRSTTPKRKRIRRLVGELCERCGIVASRETFARFFRSKPSWVDYFAHHVTGRIDNVAWMLENVDSDGDEGRRGWRGGEDDNKSHESEYDIKATLRVRTSTRTFEATCALRRSMLLVTERATSIVTAAIPVHACYVEGPIDSLLPHSLVLTSACGNEKWTLALICASANEQDRWTRALRRVSCGNSAEHTFRDAMVVGDEIGRGRTAIVYGYVDRSKNKNGVVKIVDKTALDFAAVRMLRNEYRLLRDLAHPRVVSVHAVFETRSKLLMLMDSGSNGTLLERIQGKPVMTENIAARTARGILEGVAFLHDAQVAHRDIKPENILCGENVWDVRIADFGFARYCGSSDWMTSPVGSVAYCAPEVIAGKEYRKSCDMWSVGIVLFVLLRGRLPFNNKTEIMEKPIQSVHIRERFVTRKSPFRPRKVRGVQETTVVVPRKATRAIFEHEENSALGPLEDTASSDCVDLLSRLLERDPSRRLNASQALRHAWFAKVARSDDRGVAKCTGASSPAKRGDRAGTKARECG
eukprot:g84.t1